MAVIVFHSYFHHAILSLPSSYSSSFRPSSSLLLSRNRRISCCSASSFMNPQNTSSSNRLLEFPYVSAPHRDLMVELLSSVETRLASSLRPCTLPPDVQYYQNQSATAQAALHVRSGIQSSQFTFDVAVLSIFGELDTKYKDRLKNNYYLLDKGYNSFPINLPGTLFRSALLARRRLERMIHNKINERREMKWEQTNLLSCLLNYRDENGQILTDGQIADNIIGVLFAAQDTTASVLTWILKYISDDPHLLTTIEREQMAFYVSNDGGTQTLTWAQTRNMPFTNRVIMESLRMASIVSFTYREAVADVEYNGFLIPKGWKVLPLFRIIHHNPDFFREPQNFDPSRFEGGQKPNTYVPFGNGAHACPGNELAKLEMLIMIYHLVNRFRWEVVGSKSGVQYSPFLIPKEGLPARFWMKSENLKT